MTRLFCKPSLTIDEQIDHLRAAGMTVANVDVARHWLERVSYYRLSGYWHIWRDPQATETRFLPGTDFNSACDLYGFDRRLRRVVSRGLEHVEVALRASWAYSLAHCGGSHAYLDPGLYLDQAKFQLQLEKLRRAVATSPETYIVHYRSTYDKPDMPAVWMVAEMMSFGELSRWTSLLANQGLRQEIAERLGLRQRQILSVVKHLVTVRNVCAHHGRLWNRGFQSPPTLRGYPAPLDKSLDRRGAGSRAGRLYHTLTLVAHLVQEVAPSSGWRSNLMEHLDTHPTGDLAAMGFPNDWRSRPIWT